MTSEERRLQNLYNQLHAASKGLPMPQAEGEAPPEEHQDAMQLFDIIMAVRLVAVVWHEGRLDSNRGIRALDALFKAAKRHGILDGLL